MASQSETSGFPKFGELVFFKTKDGEFVSGKWLGRFWFFGWVHRVEYGLNFFQWEDYEMARKYTRTIFL